MRDKLRPFLREVVLKNGFYIEVCEAGNKKGIKIRRDNKEDMESAFAFYKNKTILILGEYRDGIPV